MTISPELGVAIMMNNYLHDVATALLAASGVALWIMARAWERCGVAAAGPFFAAIYRGMTRLARFSLGWILLGGVPRVYFYESFEWANAAGRGQVAAIALKHVVMIALVGGGALLWLKLRKMVRELEPALGTEAQTPGGETISGR